MRAALNIERFKLLARWARAGANEVGYTILSGSGPVNSLSFIPMIFQDISNAQISKIQIITFLEFKNFQTSHVSR
jgi:hypothetical protein